MPIIVVIIKGIGEILYVYHVFFLHYLVHLSILGHSLYTFFVVGFSPDAPILWGYKVENVIDAWYSLASISY